MTALDWIPRGFIPIGWMVTFVATMYFPLAFAAFALTPMGERAWEYALRVTLTLATVLCAVLIACHDARTTPREIALTYGAVLGVVLGLRLLFGPLPGHSGSSNVEP